MQTHLHGRDMITTQEWTKDEIDTVIDVALDLKRKRALGEPHACLRDKVLAMLFFFSSTRTRASFEAGMAQLGGHAQFIDSEHHPDRPRRHRDGDRRDPRPLQRRHRHPATSTGASATSYIRDVAAARRVPVLNMQCESTTRSRSSPTC